MRIWWILFWLVGFGSTQAYASTTLPHQPSAGSDLRCTTTALWAPFNTKVNGRLVGIGLDYWEAIAQRIGRTYRCDEAASWAEVLERIHDRRSDITVATEQTPEREAFAIFSKPYCSYPYVIVTRKNVGFVYNINLLHDKKIVAGKGYSVVQTLKDHYPKLPVVEVDTVDEALRMVSDREAYAVVDVLPVLAYKLNQKAYASLKISGMLPEKFAARIMLRKDYAALMPQINRAIDSLKDEERIAINQKWIKIPTVRSLPWMYVYVFGGMLGLMGYLYWFHTRRLKREIRRKAIDIAHLKKVSRIDPLTQVGNRQMLDHALAQHIAVVRRYRQMLSVIFFDIDHFKEINDQYGHNVGDEVLVEVSRLVSDSIRESDAFGRWGGDEFLIVLPGSSQRQARRLADMLDAKIRRHVFGQAGHLACSFGVVAYRHDDTIKSLLERADRALYAAKKQNRFSPSGSLA